MIKRIALPALALVATMHLVAIVSSSANLPVMDEWESLGADGLSPHFDWNWILRPHNEHRILFTKVLTWVLYKTTGWHHIANLVLNFTLYLTVLTAFVWMLRSISPSRPRQAPGPLSTSEFFWCFLGLSGLAWENHSWGFQSQFHFFLLFYFIAIATAVRADRWFWITGLAALSSAFSFSSGVICAATVASLMVARAATGSLAWARAIPQVLTIAAGLTVWASGYQKVGGHPDYAWPWTDEFWAHYLRMIGNGWAMPSNLKAPVAGCVLFLLALNGVRTMLRRSTTSVATWFAVAGLLATAALTSLARGGFGVEQGNSSRYTEFTFFILPLAWAILTRDDAHGLTRCLTARQNRAIGLVLGTALVAFFGPKFAFTKVYHWHKTQMQAGRECVARYYSGTSPDGEICSSIYVAPLNQQLERARELNLAFTSEYRVNRQDNKETRP